MNIFVTDECPKQSALWLDDKRVNKLLVETGQMLSTNVRMMGVDDPLIYKSAFHNHPCTVWARVSSDNFIWLVMHGLHLADTYQLVYGREHKTSPIISKLTSYHGLFPSIGLTEFANCSLFKQTDLSITESYRKTMNVKWAKDKNRPTWQQRNKPDWYENLG